jgi:hypothetical protein
VDPSDVREEHLAGGPGVVRLGSTVRKPAGAWTPTIQALLVHLHENGFALSPEPLGVDEQGREMVAWLGGEAAFRPWPPILRTDEGVGVLASTLRRLHDMVRTFDPGPDATWRVGRRRIGADEIACHADFAPWNTLWHEDRLVGIIDWDMAEPGPPLMDVAFLALHLVPLRPDDVAREAGFEDEPLRSKRLELLCRTYGALEPRDVIAAVFDHHVRDRERTITLGAEGREPWVRFLADGMLDVIDEDEAWLQDHAPELLAQ